MEDILRPLYQERASHNETLGVLLVEKNKKYSPSTDHFDVILFIIVEHAESSWQVKHYEFEDKKAALHVVDLQQLNEWLMLGSHRRVVDWVVNGRVLFDRNEFVDALKTRINDFPIAERQKKIGIEFAKLVRRFSDGKELYYAGHYLDAYNNIMHALHHLARLSVIEHGFYPEVTVWNQVRQIEPEIYKLYEELSSSEEPINKRIELLIIANEFSMSSKTDLGSRHLKEIMSEKDDAWSFSELMDHDELSDYKIDLSSLIEHLIEKEYIQVVRHETKGKGIYHRTYKCVR
ncbi:nucleotidyltransferase-like protein [Alkalihalobacillus sp. AL-G]|uniref:nucleotidyltransferase-like protein n=1 Tax=Alkalihalobacillus sp. AL-G TaxID=2926399 RepID=UPI00272BD93A|nr:nucleotidyltransferase-like protein [Alkalihalobacillus sp. AL-G]WLD93998.1 nucleotidyltransferase-like protein [Alkalihalobacillus sp. AL-G]